MQISKYLSKVIGIYLIIVTLAMLINMHQFTVYVQDLVDNPALMFVTGFFTLILGLLMVVGHNIWQWHWRVIITILAWLTFLKGAIIILYPHAINTMAIQFIQNIHVAYMAASFDFILGLVLIYYGFKREDHSESRSE